MIQLKGITVVMGLSALLTTGSAFMGQPEGYVYGEHQYGAYPYYPDDGLYDFDYGDGGRGFEPYGFDEHRGKVSLTGSASMAGKMSAADSASTADSVVMVGAAVEATAKRARASFRGTLLQGLPQPHFLRD